MASRPFPARLRPTKRRSSPCLLGAPSATPATLPRVLDTVPWAAWPPVRLQVRWRCAPEPARWVLAPGIPLSSLWFSLLTFPDLWSQVHVEGGALPGSRGGGGGAHVRQRELRDDSVRVASAARVVRCARDRGFLSLSLSVVSGSTCETWLLHRYEHREENILEVVCDVRSCDSELFSS